MWFRSVPFPIGRSSRRIRIADWGAAPSSGPIGAYSLLPIAVVTLLFLLDLLFGGVFCRPCYLDFIVGCVAVARSGFVIVCCGCGIWVVVSVVYGTLCSHVGRIRSVTCCYQSFHNLNISFLFNPPYIQCSTADYWSNIGYWLCVFNSLENLKVSGPIESNPVVLNSIPLLII